MNAKKFGKSSGKFLPNRTEPNRPKPTQPNPEPNPNLGHFLIRTIRFCSGNGGIRSHFEGRDPTNNYQRKRRMDRKRNGFSTTRTRIRITCNGKKYLALLSSPFNNKELILYSNKTLNGNMCNFEH